jgi:hypothetical protein
MLPKYMVAKNQFFTKMDIFGKVGEEHFRIAKISMTHTKYTLLPTIMKQKQTPLMRYNDYSFHYVHCSHICAKHYIILSSTKTIKLITLRSIMI